MLWVRGRGNGDSSAGALLTITQRVRFEKVKGGKHLEKAKLWDRTYVGGHPGVYQVTKLPRKRGVET